MYNHFQFVQFYYVFAMYAVFNMQMTLQKMPTFAITIASLPSVLAAEPLDCETRHI